MSTLSDSKCWPEDIRPPGSMVVSQIPNAVVNFLRDCPELLVSYEDIDSSLDLCHIIYRIIEDYQSIPRASLKPHVHSQHRIWPQAQEESK